MDDTLLSSLMEASAPTIKKVGMKCFIRDLLV